MLEEEEDEVVFWKNYCDLEVEKNEAHRKSWTWVRFIARLIYLGDATPKADEKKFWKFFIAKSCLMGITILIINIIFLFVMTYVLSGTIDDSSATHKSNSNFQGIIIQLMIWVAFSAMCLIYFLVFKFKPAYFTKYMENDSYDVWISIGNCLLATRVMILVTRITRYNMVLSTVCYAVPMANDHGFMYVFSQMLIDTVQTFTFSLIPFPWPWSIYLCAIELISQMLRMHNCSSQLMGNTKTHDYDWVELTAYMALLFFYVGVLMISSLTFERSAVESYRNNMRQKKASDEKRKLVDLLCSDVKVPLQYLLHVINYLEDSNLPKSTKIKNISENITKNANLVNILADDLLLLCRIAEKRFKFNCTYKVESLSAVLQDILDAAHITSRYKELFTQDVVTILPEEQFFTDKLCLYVLLRYFIFFAIQFDTVHKVIPEQSRPAKPLFTAEVVEQVSWFTRLRRGLSGAEGDAKNRKYVLRVRVESPDPAGALSLQDSEIKSAVMICRKVTESIGGTFSGASGHFEFTMRCVPLTKSSSVVGSSGSSGSGMSSPKAGGGDVYSTLHQGQTPMRTPREGSHRLVVPGSSPLSSPIGGNDDVLLYSNEETVGLLSGTATAADNADAALTSKKISPPQPYGRVRNYSDDNPDSTGSNRIRERVPSGGQPQLSTNNSQHSSKMGSFSAGIKSRRNSGIGGTGNFEQSASVKHGANSATAAAAATATSTAANVLFKACVIIDDAVLSDTIIKIVSKMKHFERNVPIYRDIHEPDIRNCFVIFVNSVDMCHKLRGEHDYNGFVVLFSGAFTYLDDNDIASFSYALPMPCSALNEGLFVKWLETQVADTLAYNAKIAANQSSKSNNGNHGLGGSGVDSGSGSGDADGHFRHPMLETNTSIISGGNTLSYFQRQFERFITSHEIIHHFYLIFVAIYYLLAEHITAVMLVLYRFLFQTDFGILPLPPKSGESYAKWRLVNPDGVVLHHTNVIVLKNAFILLRVMLGIVEGALLVGRLTAVTLSALVVILSTVSLYYRYILKPCRISLARFWFGFTTLCWVFNLMATLNLIIEFPRALFLFSNSGTGVETAMPELSPVNGTAPTGADAILTKQFGGFTGPSLMYTTLNGNNLFVSYFIYFTWPYVNMLLFSNAFRAVYSMYLLAEYIFPVPSQFLLVLLNCILLIIVIFTVQCSYENTYRHEFVELRESILNKVFLDHCLHICLQDMFSPLQRLVNYKKELLYAIEDVSIECRLLINQSLLDRLQPLHMSDLLLSELINELEYSQLEMNNKLDGTIRLNDVILLKEFLIDIVSTFATNTEGLELKIFYEIDKHLAIIRCNKLLLTTLIVNTFALALKNIKRDIRDNPRKKDMVNEILIKATPLKSERPERFADIRLLIINIIDTSSKQEFGRHPGSGGGGGSRRNGEYGDATGEGGDYDGRYSRDDDDDDEHDDEENEPSYYRVGTNDNSGADCTTCFGQNVCYKMCMAATPPSRTAIYESGYFNHEQYGTYQRFTIPYKLTADSSKANDYLRDKKEGFRLVERNTSDLLREYTKVLQINDALGTSINSNNISNSTVQLSWIQSTKLKLNKLNRNMLFYCSKTTESMSEFSVYNDTFERMGWKCRTLYPSTCVPDYDEAQELADCILIDYSLRDTLKGISIHDLIVQLRVCGYTKVITILFDRSQEATEYGVTNKDVTSINMALIRPVGNEQVARLAVACDVGIISQLLQTEGYDYTSSNNSNGSGNGDSRSGEKNESIERRD